MNARLSLKYFYTSWIVPSKNIFLDVFKEFIRSIYKFKCRANANYVSGDNYYFGS